MIEGILLLGCLIMLVFCSKTAIEKDDADIALDETEQAPGPGPTEKNHPGEGR